MARLHGSSFAVVVVVAIMAQVWLQYSSSTVATTFTYGSIMAQVWIKYSMGQVWLRYGSSMAEVWLKY